MSALSLGWSELRRLTAGRLPKIAVLALALIPTLYGGLYLYANADPYAHLDEVPAAIVMADAGAQQAGAPVNFGREVADSLAATGGFGWVETSASAAQDGVRTGKYDAALLIGADFSADLVSAANLEPRPASLTLVTNDANNYLARTIANQIIERVRATIATQVGTEAARSFLDGFVAIHLSVGDAVDGATQVDDGAALLSTGAGTLHDGAGTLAAGATTLATGTGTLATGATTLADGLAQLRTSSAALPAQATALSAGATQVAGGARAAADAGAAAAARATAAAGNLDLTRAQIAADLVAIGLDGAEQQQILGQLDALRAPIQDAVGQVTGAATQLDTLATGAQQVADGAAALATAAPTLTTAVGQAADGASAVADGATQAAAGAGAVSTGATGLDAGAGTLADGAATLAGGAASLRSGLTDGLAQIPNPDAATVAGTAATLGDPVQVQTTALSKAGSYGAGLAPFFLSLSAWIGAYVLFLLVMPLSQRALAAGRSALRTAVGGWLTPAAIGVVQMGAMFGVVKIALGIEPEHPWLTALFLVLISVTFVAILQALNVWLGAAGQFLGLVLMLTQLVTAGGTFPWQTIPEPLLSLHRFLPMSYAVQGLRQVLYGGNLAIAVRDAAVLAAFLVVALAATTWAARGRRVWTAIRLQPELVL
ncbi:YhgE/Pip domain-containing protein [Pengzhenrongella phosphoraccumulans]|uniref:YhgE/Pip domain-containing protein n=1 Tax=Pengzhenrongella phosphoraccumulans TaxID=3114394 RepID=UPI00388E3D8C